MAELIKEINISDGIEFNTIHPVTKVNAIKDLAAALDSYSDNFIMPYMVKSVNSAMPDSSGDVFLPLTKGDTGPPGLDGRSFEVLG